MALPTVQEILDGVRGVLSDEEVTGGEVFTNDTLLPKFAMAFRELYDELARAGVPRSKAVTTVTVNSSQVTPSALGITDLESPIELRDSGGIVYPVQSPPVSDAGATLRQYCFENGNFYFLGAGPQSVRIRYFQMAPTAPTNPSSTVAVENSHNFLIYRTAGLAAASKGVQDLADRWNTMALGSPEHPGFLAGLTSLVEKSRRRMQAQRPASVKQ